MTATTPSALTSPSTIVPSGATHILAKGQLLRVDQPRGCRIECSRGAVWLTQDCLAQEQELIEGGAAAIDHRGRLVVQALAPAAVRVLPAEGGAPDRVPAAAGVLRRATVWLQRAAAFGAA